MNGKQLQFFSAFLFFILVSCTASAQLTTSRITGTISEPSGETVIGANILATHDPSGTVYGISSREDGGYDLPNLRVGGPYTIVVSYVGYDDQKKENIYLKLGEKRILNFKLEENAVLISGVTVTADRNAIIGGDRTGAETNISTEKLEKLPTISRSTADFTRLTPSSDGNSFGGRNDQFNNFSLDGSIFNNPFGLDAATPGGQSGASPISLDAIEQVTVSIAPYDVTQAGFTGAAVNAVTKSGTNTFKGSVFGFFRNEGLTGGKIGDNEILKGDLGHLQTGFSLGGPIIKNKLFFFVNAEIDNREDLGTTFVAAGQGIAGENVSRVEAADLQLVSDALLDRYGYETGPFEGYNHKTNSTKGIAKLDYNISKNHTLTATYNFLDAYKEKPGHPTAIGRRGPDFTTLQFANSGYRINNKINSGIIELKSLFGNKISNKLQVGYTSFRDSRDPFSDPFPVININIDGVRGIVAGHEPFSVNNVLDQDVIQITNNVNIYAGKHTWTFGTSLERFNFNNSFNLGFYEPFQPDDHPNPYPGGTFGPGFASVEDFVSFVEAGYMDEVVDHARATFENNNAADTWALAETNAGQWSIYGQDEIEVSPKLNVTVGVRLDMPLYFNTSEKIEEVLANTMDHDPTITWFDEDGNPEQFVHNELPKKVPLISPRFGFNYDLKGDQRTQIRGGSGLFSGRLPFVWLGNQVANPNWFFYNYTDRDFKFPQVWRTNLGYDQKVGNGWVTSMDLIYTKDINAAMVKNYGIKPPTGTLGGVDNRPVYTFDDKAVFEGFGFPIPVNGYVFTNTNVGYSFNASVQVQKSFDNDMFIMLGYNFLDAKDATSIEAEISSDAYDQNPAYGHVNTPVASRSLYGNRHRIFGTAYKTWKYSNFATTVSTFFQYAQGGTTQNDNTADYRFSYTYSGDINGDGSGLNDLIYIPTESELAIMNFETEEQRAAYGAYIAQDDYLSSNRGSYAEKYAILAPWYGQLDLRILQDYFFEVGGRENQIQFSIDILNFTNLINPSWGVKTLPANTQPVGVRFDETTGNPVYSFDTTLKTTFIDNFGLDSRWQAKLGLRYIF